jgi:hypothetical protein
MRHAHVVRRFVFLLTVSVAWMLIPGLSARVSGAELSVTVSGQANIFGAGHLTPPGPGAQGNGAGVLPPVIFLPSYIDTVQLPTVSGTIQYDLQQPLAPADGASGNDVNPSWDGISGSAHYSRMFYLTGVFLDNSEPADPAPASLDLTNWNDQLVLSPQLRQIFFLGDGHDSANALQSFTVPAGATRLYLGVQDIGVSIVDGLPESFYGDNSGSWDVQVRLVPEPTCLALVVMSTIGVLRCRKR